MTARKPPLPPGAAFTEVRFHRGARREEMGDPEPLDQSEREWRKYITQTMSQAELEAMGRELAGAQVLEASLSAAVAAMHVKADEAERCVDPVSAAHERSQAAELAVRRERTAAREEHIRTQIRSRQRALGTLTNSKS